MTRPVITLEYLFLLLKHGDMASYHTKILVFIIKHDDTATRPVITLKYLFLLLKHDDTATQPVITLEYLFLL